MNKIVKRMQLNESVVLLSVEAPYIAKKAEAGQFVIVRTGELGERIPLTIEDYDRDAGIITIVFQVVGKTTMLLSKLNEGDYMEDVTGPLGNPTDLADIESCAIIGGGLGCAIAYPQAKSLHSRGASVDSVMGFRTKDLIILENEMKAVSDNVYICTDDGSFGRKGFVTDMLKELLEGGKHYDAVIAIGPLPMMKFVSKLTLQYGIRTIVSMNPIMIDGTGMCGCCRVIVDGKVRFACVDGPDFDGHKVDFDDAINRLSMYRQQEKDHICRLTGVNGK